MVKYKPDKGCPKADLEAIAYRGTAYDLDWDSEKRTHHSGTGKTITFLSPDYKTAVWYAQRAAAWCDSTDERNKDCAARVYIAEIDTEEAANCADLPYTGDMFERGRDSYDAALMVEKGEESLDEGAEVIIFPTTIQPGNRQKAKLPDAEEYAVIDQDAVDFHGVRHVNPDVPSFRDITEGSEDLSGIPVPSARNQKMFFVEIHKPDVKVSARKPPKQKRPHPRGFPKQIR